MPAKRFGRTKYRCIGYLEDEAAAKAAAKAAKPRAPRKILTPEEKETKKAEKIQRDIVREKKKSWEEKLVPWTLDADFRFPIGTRVMYKSDAKSAYGLTEKDILTLRSKSIPGSLKTFFSQEDAKALSNRKFTAGLLNTDLANYNLLSSMSYDRCSLRVFEKKDNSRRRKTNFYDISNIVDAEFSVQLRRQLMAARERMNNGLGCRDFQLIEIEPHELD